MKAFENAISRIDEINMPKSLRLSFCHMMKLLENTFLNMEGLRPDFDDLLNDMFEKRLLNNLKINIVSKDGVGREAGRYTYNTNTIVISDDNDSNYFKEVLLHEFIHFIIHNLYQDLYFDKKSSFPIWLDEVMTQRLTILSQMESAQNVSGAYQDIIDLTGFIEWNLKESFKCVDFLNGDIIKTLDKCDIDRFNYYNDLIAIGWDSNIDWKEYYNNTRDYKSKVIKWFYSKYASDLLRENPDIKFEDYLYKLAEYGSKSLATGKTLVLGVDSAFSSVGVCDFNDFDFMKQFFISKGKGLEFNSLENEQNIKSCIENYLLYCEKQIVNDNSPADMKYAFTNLEKMANYQFPKLKKSLITACTKYDRTKNKENNERALDRFLDNYSQRWLHSGKSGIKDNIDYINKIAEAFESSLYVTKERASIYEGLPDDASCVNVMPSWLRKENKLPIGGNLKTRKPKGISTVTYNIQDNDIVQQFNQMGIDDYLEVVKTFKDGGQCNVCIKINDQLVPIVHLLYECYDKTNDKSNQNIAISINWKDIWSKIPKELKNQIKEKVVVPMEPSNLDFLQ